jgi:SHAQKYF class myb-like DNA-binding protein
LVAVKVCIFWSNFLLHLSNYEFWHLFDILAEATPKGVLKLMKADNLTIYHVKSHLQVCWSALLLGFIVTSWNYLFDFELTCFAEIQNCTIQTRIIWRYVVFHFPYILLCVDFLQWFLSIPWHVHWFETFRFVRKARCLKRGVAIYRP